MRGRRDGEEIATAAGGTHPTGMHSFCIEMFLKDIDRFVRPLVSVFHFG